METKTPMKKEEPQEDFVQIDPAVPEENTKSRIVGPQTPKIPAFAFTVTNCWHVFDKITCVNFEGDTARRHTASTFFAKHEVPVEFFTLKKNPRGEKVGRFEAHILAMRAALKDPDLNNLLLFDDNPDILQLPNAECVKEVVQFIQYRGFDIFSLDTAPAILFDVTKSVPNFHKVFQTHVQSSSAYVVSRKFMERMIKMDYDLLQASLSEIFSLNNNAFAVLPAWFGTAIDAADVHSNTAQIRDIVQKGTSRAKGWYAANSGGTPAIFLVLIAIIVVFILLIVLL